MSGLTRPRAVHAIMAQLDMHPSKSLGQNFLIDAHLRDRILEEAQLAPDSRVVEVGPGLGALTERMVEQVQHLTCVEIDERLVGHLQTTFGHRENFTLIHGDALDVDLAGLFAAGANRFVSNLPYSVGSRILMDLFALPQSPEVMSVTVQLDVAQRLIATPRSPEYSLLGIWAQIFYEVTLAKKIKPTCFIPVPRVDSGIVSLVRRADVGGTSADRERVLQLVKFCFTRRRKQLGNTRRAAPASMQPDFEKLFSYGIQESQRPEEISVALWRALLDPEGA